jgi:ABC-type dipeptide/oligopeptide/nickel transport system permease component
MLVYAFRRILVAIPLLIAASFLSFALTTMMGSPLEEYMARSPRPSPGQIAAAEQRIGLDKPFLERYGEWAINFTRGDWGTTVTPGQGSVEVKPKIMHASWVTIQLVLGAEVLAMLIGVAVGMVGAVRQYSMFDYVATGSAFVMFSMPVFCLAVMIKWLSIDLNDYLERLGLGRWIRTAGPPNGGFHGGFVDQLYQYTGTYLLPTLCLVAIQYAGYSRFQRSSLLTVLQADYVRTAEAKGLSKARVLLRHALRNALIPIATVFALGIGGTLAGAIITETVFGWQGMGKLTVDAVTAREPNMVLGIMMVTAVFVLACNLLADIGYAILDPRIRLRE